MTRFFKWIRNSFTAPCNEGAMEMWYDATPEERVQLAEFWRKNPIRVGSFY